MSNQSMASLTPGYRIDLARVYPQSVERVWKAISTAGEIEAWMKYPTRLESHIGGKIFIDFDPDPPLEGIVCELEHEQALAYSWGDGIVKWELESSDDGTRLQFSHSGVSSDQVIGLSAGWHAFIDHLEAHLAGEQREDRFDELNKQYKREMEPSLAD